MSLLTLLAPPLPWARAQSASGDAERGRALALSRTQGLCVLCHALPGASPHQVGNLGPDLAGVASRLSPQALRERLLHPHRFNPGTIMPGYGPPLGTGIRVTPARQGQPLLDEQSVADVLAYLDTLR